MRRVASIVVGTLALAGCATSTDEPKSSASDKVVIATHDSWAAPEELMAEFEEDSGLDVTIVPSGDAGQLTNKLVLTKDNPIADAVYGIDNTFASRAVGEGVVDGELTSIDTADVCVNVDDVWFAEHRLEAPKTLDDLTEPAYKDLFVTPGAATSSPGFAFLLATIGKYGEDGWQDYWKKLMANGAKLTSGWTDAYEVDFTAGGGKGTRPIVLSYNSSPPFTIPEGGDKPTTSALLDTCFRQIEYAGVLDGAQNADGAARFIEFLASKEFQESLPENMYVFPVNPDAELPQLWAQWAKPAPAPIEVDADTITEKRDEWLTEWSDLTTR